MIPLPFPRWLRIAAFVAFAILLFVGTHWPQLRIHGPIRRPDLIVHLVAFGIWALALCLSGLIGNPGSRKTALRCLLVGAVYAAFDETTQMIPILGRFAGLDDYLFNLIGLVLGSSLSLLFRVPPSARSRRESSEEAQAQ